MPKPRFLNEMKEKAQAASQSSATEELPNAVATDANSSSVAPAKRISSSATPEEFREKLLKGLAVAPQELVNRRVYFSASDIELLRSLAEAKGYPPDRLRAFLMALARGAR